MNVGEKFRIKNNSGYMDVKIIEKIDSNLFKRDGISIGAARWEFHSDGYCGLISTLYSNVNNNRDIYIANYNYQDCDSVSYWKGFIEKFEHENQPVYNTI